VTNWVDPDRAPTRMMLFALMLAGLALSISIPEAFGRLGLLFACAYVAMEMGRSAFMLWALTTPEQAHLRRNFVRILCWQGLAAPFWIVGGLAEPEATRPLLWLAAVAIWTAAPALGFRVPGLGRSTTADWTVEGRHLAERCGLFIIIALGESILVTGATFAKLPWTVPTVAAFVVAFLGSVAMWWVYFHIGAERGSRHITRTRDPGRLARLGYTYLHIPIVAGIVVTAVGDEMVLAHPGGRADAKEVAAILGGPALYLVGNALFKRITLGHLPLSHELGLAALAVVALLAASLPPLAIAAAAAATLIFVAVWEHVSLGGPDEE
jgi:low temperature requirement protein LtrA